jgi:ParB-like chromosome segregation protein Spo0J
MIKSFKEMKKFAPLVVDKNNYLIDGYHRYLACLQVGIETIPVIRLNVTLGK